MHWGRSSISWSVVCCALMMVAVGLSGVSGASAQEPLDLDQCTVLAADDVKFTSPEVTGIGHRCYVLPDGPGTVVNVSNSPSGGVTYRDATGAPGCGEGVGNPRAEPPFALCRLQGVAPFRMDIYGSTEQAYSMQVFRVTGDTGCPAGQTSDFGSTDGQMMTTDPLKDHECVTLSGLSDGGHAVAFGAAWRIVDARGEITCFDELPFGARGVLSCRPGVGPVTLIWDAGQRRSSDPQAPSIAVVDMSREDGCRDQSTSWEAPPVTISDGNHLQIDCGVFDEPPGTVLVGASRPLGSSYTYVMDLDGGFVCEVRWFRRTCVLDGEGPYRFVSGYNAFDSYQVVLRALSSSRACVPTSIIAWGQAPSPAFGESESGCREFVTTGQRTVIREAVNEPPSFGLSGAFVMDESGDEVCQGSLFCSEPHPAGTYWALLDLFDPVRAAAGVYDTESETGCRPLTVGRPVSGSLVRGQLDCYRLDVEERDDVYFATLAETPGLHTTRGYVIDADGRVGCYVTIASTLGSCVDLRGTGPFRLVVAESAAVSYQVRTLDPTDANDCRFVAAGQETVRLTGADRFSCLRFNASDPVERISLTTDTGRASFGAGGGPIGNNNSCTSDQPLGVAAERYDFSCHRVSGQGPWQFSLTVLGDGTDQRITVERTPIPAEPDPSTEPEPTTDSEVDPSARPIRSRVRPRVRGVHQAGKVLRATRGAWRPRPTNFYYQWRVNGRDISGATGRQLRVKRYWRGKRIRVIVGVTAPGRASAIASSRAVRINRR